MLAALPGLVAPFFAPDQPLDDSDEYVRELAAQLLADPLDLNRSGPEDLLQIPWLDPVLAWRIVAHRDSVGRFSTVAELLRVPGMTPGWFELVAPYVRVPQHASSGAPAGRPPVAAAARLTLRADTLPPARARCAGSVVAALRRGPWSALLAAENDPGEPVLPDWFGGSVALDAGRTKLCAGDFTFGSGLGLVFSGPHRRYADRVGTNPRGPSFARPLRAPLETRALRGLAGEYASERWAFAGFGSWAARSAALGEDGGVRRVRYDGRHADSLALAGRNAVDEHSAGLQIGLHQGGSRLGLSLGRVGYAPGVAPAESSRSFHGRNLAFAGLGFDRLGEPYRFAAELAGSTGGGLAFASALEGNWNRFRLALGADARQARYFAPLGRWQSTSNRHDRVSVRARARWDPGPLAVTLAGSSYRDYDADSLPARLGCDVAMPLGPVRLALGLERRYRLDEPRFRRAHAGLRWQPGRSFGLALDYDEGHPAATGARGRSLALQLEAGSERFRFKAGAARFDVSGNVRMYLSEPTVYGPARGYSTAATGWRFHAAFGARLGPGRFGLNAGYAPGAGPGWNLGLRLEAGSA